MSEARATNAGSAAGAVAIIPARLGSTRFPRKVLADATGKPLIQHVWERARLARRVGRVVIATDAEDVRSAVARFGGEAVMTRADHPNGTSRLAEAADALGLPDATEIVNVQGDEPELDPGLIDAAIERLSRGDAEIATIASPFSPGQDPGDPNLVKAVLRPNGLALYFTRAHAPFPRAGGEPMSPLRHVGLYAYSAGFLRVYARLAPTPLERCEMLEQLRALEHGYRIAAAILPSDHGGIDTPEQYAAFVARQRA